MKRIRITVDEFNQLVARYDQTVAAQEPLLQQHLYTRGLLGHYGIKTFKYLSALGLVRLEFVSEPAATWFALRHVGS